MDIASIGRPQIAPSFTDSVKSELSSVGRRIAAEMDKIINSIRDAVPFLRPKSVEQKPAETPSNLNVNQIGSKSHADAMEWMNGKISSFDSNDSAFQGAFVGGISNARYLEMREGAKLGKELHLASLPASNMPDGLEARFEAHKERLALLDKLLIAEDTDVTAQFSDCPKELQDSIKQEALKIIDTGFFKGFESPNLPPLRQELAEHMEKKANDTVALEWMNGKISSFGNNDSVFQGAFVGGISNARDLEMREGAKLNKEMRLASLPGSNMPEGLKAKFEAHKERLALLDNLLIAEDTDIIAQFSHSPKELQNSIKQETLNIIDTGIFKGVKLPNLPPLRQELTEHIQKKTTDIKIDESMKLQDTRLSDLDVKPKIPQYTSSNLEVMNLLIDLIKLFI